MFPRSPGNRSPRTAAALVALAAFCWGLSGGIGGLLLAKGWNPFFLALCRGGFGLIVALLWLGLRREASGLGSARLWLWSLVAGLGVAGNFTFYFMAIAEGSVAVAATLMYCAPVYVFLVSFALGVEPATPLKWSALILASVGVVLLTGLHDLAAEKFTLAGVLAGLMSGLCYAGFIFAFRFASPHGSPQAILLVAFALLVALLYWPADGGQAIAALTTPDWPLLVTLGVLGAGLSFFLFVVGLRNARPTVASVVALVEPVTASLFGVAILNERLDGLQVIGMALILATATVLSVQSNRQG